MVMVYHRERIWIKVNQGKKHIEWSHRGFQSYSFWCLPLEARYVTFPVPVYMPRVLPARETCPNLAVQRFYRGSIAWVWLSDYLGGWSQLPGGLIPGDLMPLPLNHVVLPAWLRLSGVASPTLKSIVTGSHPKPRYSYEVWHRLPPGSCKQRPNLSLGQVRFFITQYYLLCFIYYYSIISKDGWP